MATVTKGKTFISGETVEPADMHQLVDSATVTFSTAADTDDSTLEVSGNKFRAKDGGITAAKLSATLDLSSKTVTLPDSNIGTSKIANAAVTAAKLDGAQTGSAPIYGCRAWVNFDGTRNEADTGASTDGANVKIRASGNVASVLRNSAGDYTINLTTAMPNANYAVMGVAGRVGASGVGTVRFPDSIDPLTTSTARIQITRFDGVGLVAPAYVTISIIA
jgi:hypothetical protein